MNLSTVERENLRLRVCQQNWGVGRDEKLDVVVAGQQIMKEKKKAKLTLGRKRSLGFVNDIEA
jgi:hypothetical protein